MKRIKMKMLKSLVSTVMAVALLLSFAVTMSASVYFSGPSYISYSNQTYYYDVTASAYSTENPVVAYASIGYKVPGDSFVQTNWGYDSSANPTTVTAGAYCGFNDYIANYVYATGTWANDGTGRVDY